MKIQYFGDDFIIDCQNHSISIAEQRHIIRPKTFQLLLTLINKRDQIIDKQTLLNEIWDDVNVDEQVIFQSITEIRKIFADKKVIQTHPRKGYSWVAEVQEKTFEQTNFLTELPNKLASELPVELTTEKFNFRLLVLPLFIFSLLFALSFSVWFYFIADNATNNTNEMVTNKGTLFILPTKNNIIDREFDWVAMGVMDTLISQAKDHSQVMPIDYVLMSMRNANMNNHDHTPKQINRLFKITGAKIIVETEISRLLGEYQLIYKLHYINDTKRGVIFNKSINDVVTDLTKVLADITDYHLQHTAINSSEFNHELFVEALTLAQQGKSDGAIQLLKSLIIIEPNNIPAYKILINWLQYKGDFASALVLSTQAIARMKENEPDKTSIYYRHGYNLLKLHKIDQAWHFSKLIKQQLKTEINPFYHGLSSQLEGELYVEQQDYKNAKVAFNQSLKQFEAISFSIGMTSLHCLLAKIEANLGDHKASEKQLELARKVVSQYEIESLLPLFKIELTM